MSYQVIARKWRPQTFAELVGQSHVAQTLINGLKSGRLAHAILLTGPRGTGKTSTARILAKSIRCPNAKDFVPCNQCTECEDIAQGRALNVMEIDGASHNGVDAIRELRDSVGFMPSTGRFKIYIIDEVHMLSTSAFNALLKTLEEPPEHVVFILATTEVHKIPNTILSRCQRLEFRRILAREIVERMAEICRSENVSADQDSLWLIARQAEGSMRDSQSLLDQVITFGNGAITADITSQALGLTDRTLLLDALKTLVNRDEETIIPLVERTYQSGLDAKVFVQDLLQELRHLLLVRMGLENSQQLLDLPDSEISLLKELSSLVNIEDIHFLFDMAMKGAQDIPKAFDPQLVLEMLLFRMVAAPRIEPLSRPPSINRTEVRLNKAAPLAPIQTATSFVETKAPAPKTPEPPQYVQGATVEERWYQFAVHVNKRSAFLGAKLAHSRVINDDTEKKLVQLAISASHKFLFEQLNTAANKNQISVFLNELWGPGYQVEFQLLEADLKSKTPQEVADDLKQKRKATVKSQVENHPIILELQKSIKSEVRNIKEIP